MRRTSGDVAGISSLARVRIRPTISFRRLGVALQAIEQHVLAEALAGKAQRGVDARERRTQFVRDVRDELPLTGDEALRRAPP